MMLINNYIIYKLKYYIFKFINNKKIIYIYI